VIDGDAGEFQQLGRQAYMPIPSEQSKREKGRIRRSFGLRRKNAARGSGRLVRQTSAIEEDHMRAAPRKFAGGGEADDSSPDDDDVARGGDRYST